jgi:hypothetical protein
VPVAESGLAWPYFTRVVAGVTATETSAAGATVNDVLPVTPETVAETVVEPADVAVSKPLVLIVTMAVLEELQDAVVETSWEVLSLYFAVAVNCCVRPAATLAAEGVTATDVSVGGFGAESPPPPQAPFVLDRAAR